MFNLGMCYRDGHGVDVSLEEALVWFKRSGEAGLILGKLILLRQARVLCQGGSGVAQNVRAGFAIFEEISKMSSDMTHGEVFFRLGEIYRSGSLDGGRRPDFVKARECHERGFRNGYPDAGIALANMLLEGEGGGQDVARALDILQRVVDSENRLTDAGSVAAQTLGIIYEKGKYNIPRDYDRALQYYGAGGRLGGWTCMFREAMLQFQIISGLRESTEIRERRNSALTLIKDAAEMGGHLPAMQNYGAILRDGKYDVEPNVREAMGWFEKASDKGYYISMKALGAIYERGYPSVPQDLNKASEWYCKAAIAMRKDSSPSAKLALGQLYASGVPGIPKDLKQAEVLFRAAGDLGEPELKKWKMK
jgi:TPR repeat protein